MSDAVRVLLATAAACGLLVLFGIVSALGGLGPGELATGLLVTVPVAVLLYRAAALVVTRGGAQADPGPGPS